MGMVDGPRWAELFTLTLHEGERGIVMASRPSLVLVESRAAGRLADHLSAPAVPVRVRY